jgi:hypothetical protein
MSTKKKQLLDPIGTICRLIGLKFKKENTKFGLYKHSVIIQEPYKSFIVNTQSFARWANDDDANNISELYSAIIHVIEWYILPLQNIIKNNDDINEKYLQVADQHEAKKYLTCLEKLCTYFCTSLNELQLTYYNELEGNAVLALQFFINLLQDALNGMYNKNKLPKCFIVQNVDTLLDEEKIKELWNYTKILEISQEYDKCFQLADRQDDNKEKKINGYLMVVDELLNISENSFKKLIENTNKG